MFHCAHGLRRRRFASSLRTPTVQRVNSQPNLARLMIVLVVLASAAFGDTIILHDGSSYSGHLQGTANDVITFTDGSGVQYKFPAADVQTLVFTASGDTITLRNGKAYSGQYTGPAPIAFQGSEGITYRFPVRDVASIVFSHSAPPAPQVGQALVIPEGSEIAVRTGGSIESQDASTGELFPVTIANDVIDSQGGIAIPRGSSAQLVVRNITSGGAVHSPELVLDLFSVTVNGKEYRVETTNVDFSSKRGLGANRRTAEFTGGGAGIGALMGAIFGGGKGAAIGVASGAAGGALTQLFTRGKKISVPAESELRFQLERTLVLRP